VFRFSWCRQTLTHTYVLPVRCRFQMCQVSIFITIHYHIYFCMRFFYTRSIKVRIALLFMSTISRYTSIFSLPHVFTWYWTLLTILFDIFWIAPLAFLFIKGPLGPRKAFIFFSISFYFWYCFIVSNKLLSGRLPEWSSSSDPFWQIVHLQRFSILYRTWKAVLFTFCCFYDMLFYIMYIKRYLIQVTTI
jgi:hypothetical protein